MEEGDADDGPKRGIDSTADREMVAQVNLVALDGRLH